MRYPGAECLYTVQELHLWLVAVGWKDWMCGEGCYKGQISGSFANLKDDHRDLPWPFIHSVWSAELNINGWSGPVCIFVLTFTLQKETSHGEGGSQCASPAPSGAFDDTSEVGKSGFLPTLTVKHLQPRGDWMAHEAANNSPGFREPQCSSQWPSWLWKDKGTHMAEVRLA